MYSIHCIVNNPVTSNCFILSEKGHNNCLVVDPGTEDCKDLLTYLRKENLYPEYVILTHEHIDHIIGCKELKKHFFPKIVCSSVCEMYMRLPKYNLTKFSEQFEGKSFLLEADIAFKDMDFTLMWNGRKVHFFETQGHSLGSICFNIENDLFVGDTLIKGFKTTTALPGSSKEDLLVTFSWLLEHYDPVVTTVYSGHFEAFPMQDVMQEIYGQIDFFQKKLVRQKLRNV